MPAALHLRRHLHLLLPRSSPPPSPMAAIKSRTSWARAARRVKIGDFGLAVAIDRSRLTTEGMMIGTVSYMPPEQAMGGEVTPRSDL